MRNKCIVFDFFGVICSEVAPFWLAHYLSQSDAVAVKETIVKAADRGELSQEQLFLALSDITNVPPSVIDDEWQAYAHINNDIIQFIKQLSGIYRIGLLTNSPSPFVRSLIARHGLHKLFDSIVVSSEIRCAKPDRDSYCVILDRLSVTAADALMIDDNPENIAGATGVGMAGIVYCSNRQLKAAFSEWEAVS